MKRLLYIYNPTAGRKTAKVSLSEVIEIFARQGYEITAHPTLKRGDATTAVIQLGAQHDRVVCCGGDGTLNETVQGLLTLPQEQRPVLGYIPTGTTNDFSRTLELPKTLMEQAEVAGVGTPQTIDVGDAQGHPFTYVAAFGLFTDVSYSTPQASKNLLGHFAYVLEGMGRLASIPSYHMTVSANGREVEGDFIYGMVGNTVSVGGLVNLPRDKVCLDDGLFEVILIRQPKTAKDWQSILTALTTLELSEDEGAVLGFSSGEITFTCDKPVAWTVDGEFGGEYASTTVRSQTQAITIACGSSFFLKEKGTEKEL